jgi:NAD(P)H-dependent flavin oxidoreductase YrpB (nitropropane dioxygenase family)
MKLGIEYPIVQGTLGGLSSHKLTAAVSNFGGLGSFGAVGFPPAAIKEAIAEIRALTPATTRQMAGWEIDKGASRDEYDHGEGRDHIVLQGLG